MVQRRYPGLACPEAAFDELRPLREKLIRTAGEYAPTDWRHAELYKPVLALDAAAEAVTDRPRFFGSQGHTTPGGPPAQRWPPKRRTDW
jgi:hypothetical protein